MLLDFPGAVRTGAAAVKGSMKRADITAKRLKRRNNNILMLAGLVAAAILILGLMAALGSSDGGDGSEVTITVPDGATSIDIAEMLMDEGVIADKDDFLSQAADAGIDQQLQAGVFAFRRGEPIADILNKLKRGLQDPQSVLTVPEGYSIYDIADLVAAKTDVSREEYLVAIGVNGRDLPLAGSDDALDLEGYLFPSTYSIEPDFDVDRFVDRQLETFSQEAGGLEWDKAADLGLTEYEALIVASMVEREVRVDSERPLVAAVIYNRIREGMKLEIDATVQYALGYWKEDLTIADLETDSLFNTRLYEGLPPGPICNPGIDSINAALNPADVGYLYYVASGDAEGTHIFTETYEEFLAAGG